MWVKICGITTVEDAAMAIEYGADALGLNFFPESPRRITFEEAEEIVRIVSSPVEWVGVFVNEDPVRMREEARRLPLDWIQLHGDEDRSICEALEGFQRMKAIRVHSQDDLEGLEQFPVERYLLDSPTQRYGGSGKTWVWEWAAKAVQNYPIVVAGGLTPENVRRMIEEVHPFGVDVCSGVESSPGKKDPDRLRRFIEAAKG